MTTLDADAYTRLIANAEVLSRDPHGDKVFALQDGRILKLFRIKRRVTSARLWNYARRFASNARRLCKRGFLSVSVEATYDIPHIQRQGVVYLPLQGVTLRDAMREQFDQDTMNRFARFIADLHNQGVYFRAMHLNNVLICEGGKFGIIDMSDMWIWPWRVGIWKSLRNFRHIINKNDADIFWKTNLNHFRRYYLEQRKLPGWAKLIIKSRLPDYTRVPSPV